jgi:hypothetical protein
MAYPHYRKVLSKVQDVELDYEPVLWDYVVVMGLVFLDVLKMPLQVVAHTVVLMVIGAILLLASWSCYFSLNHYL